MSCVQWGHTVHNWASRSVLCRRQGNIVLCILSALTGLCSLCRRAPAGDPAARDYRFQVAPRRGWLRQLGGTKLSATRVKRFVQVSATKGVLIHQRFMAKKSCGGYATDSAAVEQSRTL
ncbi:hypothetical protein VTK56DRAFT_6696 [Thermocarpiscus australiensis]